eukprot:6308687-Pyramimonas_sp.AAC.1
MLGKCIHVGAVAMLPINPMPVKRLNAKTSCMGDGRVHHLSVNCVHYSSRSVSATQKRDNSHTGFSPANTAFVGRTRSTVCAAKGGKGKGNDACLYVEVNED